MGRAKEIVIKVIPSTVANPFVKKHHYSGKVVNNSCLHFGAFLDGKLHGVLSYGPSMDKSKIVTLVNNTKWHEFLELNRMAFDEYLPRNSESFAIAKTIKLIKKHAPHIKWIISFADGCSCGDGTIYRASNFKLVGIKRNKDIILLPSGEKTHLLSIQSSPNTPRKELGGKSFYDVTGGKYDPKPYLALTGGVIIKGFQLKYIYFIDKKCEKDLTVPILPFSKIDELGAGMYKGKHILQSVRHSIKTEKKEPNDPTHE
jgi:hypothetical protein